MTISPSKLTDRERALGLEVAKLQSRIHRQRVANQRLGRLRNDLAVIIESLQKIIDDDHRIMEGMRLQIARQSVTIEALGGPRTP